MSSNACPAFFHALVEDLEKFRGRSCDAWLKPRFEFEHLAGQPKRRPRRQPRDVSRQSMESHRFVMRLVTAAGVVQRDPLQKPSSVLHFSFIVDCDCLAECSARRHDGSIAGIADNFCPPSNLRAASSVALALSGPQVLVRARSGRSARSHQPHSAPRCRQTPYARLPDPFHLGLGSAGISLARDPQCFPYFWMTKRPLRLPSAFDTPRREVEGVEEASVRAVSKIDQILPPRLGRPVAALQTVVSCRPAR